MLKYLLLLVYKDFLIELKSKSALGSIFLYMGSMIFVCYLAFDGAISDKIWNALFWIILLFTAFNSVLKSFIREDSDRYLYYFTLISPKTFINAKLIYNTLFLLCLAIMAFVIFMIFMGNVVANPSSFLIVLFAGVVGLSSVLTLMSAIASKIRNNFTLVSILSFPIILPQLLILLNLSSMAIGGATIDMFYTDIIISVLISFIAIGLSNILFPYIWQE